MDHHQNNNNNVDNETSVTKCELTTTVTATAIETGTTTGTSKPVLAPEELTLWQAVSKWRKVILYCLGLSSSIILYGYDQAIVGSVSGLPAFQRDFGQPYGEDYILPSLWLGLWNVGTPLGVMVGAVLGGWFQDRFGRRPSLAVASIAAAMGIAIMFVCFVPEEVLTRRGLFLAGKLVQGVGIGMIISTTQTYMSEVLPPVLRGSVLSFLTIFTLCGQLIGGLVVFTSINMPGRKSYTVCFGSQWPFSIACLVMAFFLPESPTYLIRKNWMDDAYKSQQRLNEPGAHTESVIERLCASIEEERRNAESTYAECFRGKNCRRTLIAIFASVLPQSFGLTLLAKASYFLQVVGMGAKLSVMMVVVGIVLGLISNVGSFWTLSRFGRRQLILTTLSAATILWTAVGVAGCFRGEPSVWATAAGMMLIIVICGLGVWPTASVVMAEASSLHLRARTQGIAWFTTGFSAGLVGFVLPYIFNPDEGNLRAKTGFVYGGLGTIFVVTTFFVVPEMKGRDWVEIDKMFEQRIAARDFEKYVHGDHGLRDL